MGKVLFHSFLFPNFGNVFFSFPSRSRIEGMGFFQFPSRSRTSGMELSIPIPVPELPNVIPAHPCYQVFIAWVVTPKLNSTSASHPPDSFSSSPSHPPHMTREREVSPRETSQSQPSLFFPSTNPNLTFTPTHPFPPCSFILW